MYVVVAQLLPVAAFFLPLLLRTQLATSRINVEIIKAELVGCAGVLDWVGCDVVVTVVVARSTSARLQPMHRAMHLRLILLIGRVVLFTVTVLSAFARSRARQSGWKSGS